MATSNLFSLKLSQFLALSIVLAFIKKKDVSETGLPPYLDGTYSVGPNI
jgi:hypothetical protein